MVPGALIAGSLHEGIDMIKDDSECFIVGGAEIYREAFAHADRIYLTRVEAKSKIDKVKIIFFIFYRIQKNHDLLTEPVLHQQRRNKRSHFHSPSITSWSAVSNIPRTLKPP